MLQRDPSSMQELQAFGVPEPMFRQDLSQPPTEFWLGSSPETLPSPSVRSPLRRDRITEATLPGDEYETTEYGGLPEPFMRQPNGFGGLPGTHTHPPGVL
jgi:hypothetical protein